ncbi:hypothetical protein GCM10027418_19180 [Mariniluteicoccus endophyticus]
MRETFTGWRLEALRTDGWGSRSTLAATTRARPYWNTTHTAECTRNPDHAPPHPGCSCGFYAVPTRDALRTIYAPSQRVWGDALAAVRVRLAHARPAPAACRDPAGTHRGHRLTIIGPVLTHPHQAAWLRDHLPDDLTIRPVDLDQLLAPASLIAGTTRQLRGLRLFT